MSEELVTQQTAITPMSMLQMAVSQNADLDKLEKLMALQERWEANEAKKAYFDAMSAFKANPPQVVKDMENKQFNSKYSSIEAWLPVIEELGKHGLSSSWEYPETPDKITVTCILRHKLGHSERVTLSGPSDTSGKKNPLQEMKSTRTYLRIETLSGVTGLTSSSVNDDGNGAFTTADVMPEDDLNGYVAAIETATTQGAIGKVYLQAIERASTIGDQVAMNRLNVAKNEALLRIAK